MKYTCQKCDCSIIGHVEIVYDIIHHEKICEP